MHIVYTKHDIFYHRYIYRYVFINKGGFDLFTGEAWFADSTRRLSNHRCGRAVSKKRKSFKHPLYDIIIMYIISVQVELFSMQILHQKLDIEACGMYVIDYSLLYMVKYLIHLIPFHLNYCYIFPFGFR